MAKILNKRRRKTKNGLIKPEFIRLKRWIMSLFSFLVAMEFGLASYAEQGLSWHKSDTGIDEAKITAICVIKDAPRVIFAGGERAIYKSVDSGKSWFRVLMLKGQIKGTNFIAYETSDTYKIFAATGQGLYASSDGGKNWKRCFKGKDGLQRQVTSIAVDKDNPGLILIATRKGLFQSLDSGRHWLSHNSFINKEVRSVAIGENFIYACAVDGVYSAKKGSDLWDRIYVYKAQEQENSNDDSDNHDTNEEEKISRLNQISTYENRAYLATDRGLFIFNEAEAKSWQPLNSEGLLTKKIKFILPADKRIFAATDKGVFSYDKRNGSWKSISSGLTSLGVNSLDFTQEGELLYAAGDRGIYAAKLNNTKAKDLPPAAEVIDTIISREPSISDIQQAAIEYAEVSPEKIEWMRHSAKNKAWLPNVSAGLDGDINRTIDLDRGGTQDPDFYIEGPRDKGWGWDVNLTWDLGELIWNDDQTNIDVRSKLMVQLRNDVLDEVTKLYFERRRLQCELYANPPENEGQRLFNQLRLDELTANIDALTGGYLSAALKRTDY